MGGRERKRNTRGKGRGGGPSHPRVSSRRARTSTTLAHTRTHTKGRIKRVEKRGRRDKQGKGLTSMISAGFIPHTYTHAERRRRRWGRGAEGDTQDATQKPREVNNNARTATEHHTLRRPPSPLPPRRRRQSPSVPQVAVERRAAFMDLNRERSSGQGHGGGNEEACKTRSAEVGEAGGQRRKKPRVDDTCR